MPRLVAGRCPGGPSPQRSVLRVAPEFQAIRDSGNSASPSPEPTWIANRSWAIRESMSLYLEADDQPPEQPPRLAAARSRQRRGAEGLQLPASAARLRDRDDVAGREPNARERPDSPGSPSPG